MAKKNPLLIAAAAAGAWLLYKGAGTARAAMNLTSEIIAARKLRLSGTDLGSVIRMRFTNPTSSPVTFSGIVLNVFYKGTQIGTVINNTGATIQPTSQTTAEFPFTLSILALGTSIVSQLRSGGKLGAARFTGFIQAVGVDIPVDITYALPSLSV
jgi:LEA14-like dessication related protein